jgi:O-antigen/teichoic acid export membrane protein
LTKWVIALTFPLALLIIIFARPFMRIFGPGFESGWPILVIGTIGQLVNCGVGSVGYLLLMSGNERRLMKVQFVMAAVMVAFSIALVPLWGVIGAAVASATTNIGVNAWNLFEVRGSLGILPYNRGYLRLLLPSAVILFVELLVKRYMNLFHHDWIAVACALVSGYLIFAAIILLSGLDSDDRLIASAIWSRIRGGFAWIRPEAAA